MQVPTRPSVITPEEIELIVTDLLVQVPLNEKSEVDTELDSKSLLTVISTVAGSAAKVEVAGVKLEIVGAVLSTLITALADETILPFPTESLTAEALTCTVTVPVPVQPEILIVGACDDPLVILMVPQVAVPEAVFTVTSEFSNVPPIVSL